MYRITVIENGKSSETITPDLQSLVTLVNLAAGREADAIIIVLVQPS